MFQSLAVFTASVRSRSALWRHLQEIWKVFVFEDLGLWAVLGMFLFLFLFLMKGKWSRNWVWGQGFWPLYLKIQRFSHQIRIWNTRQQSRLGGMRQWRRNWRGERCRERLCVRNFYLAGAAEPTCPALLVWSCTVLHYLALPCPASLVPQPTCCFFGWGPCAAPPPILLSCLLLSTQNHKDTSNPNPNTNKK